MHDVHPTSQPACYIQTSLPPPNLPSLSRLRPARRRSSTIHEFSGQNETRDANASKPTRVHDKAERKINRAHHFALCTLLAIPLVSLLDNGCALQHLVGDSGLSIKGADIVSRWGTLIISTQDTFISILSSQLTLRGRRHEKIQQTRAACQR